MEPERACYAAPTAYSLRYCLAESRNVGPAAATAEDWAAEQAQARKAQDDRCSNSGARECSGANPAPIATVASPDAELREFRHWMEQHCANRYQDAEHLHLADDRRQGCVPFRDHYPD